jgi:uncharacterized protein (DUF983 family)
MPRPPLVELPLDVVPERCPRCHGVMQRSELDICRYVDKCMNCGYEKDPASDSSFDAQFDI